MGVLTMSELAEAIADATRELQQHVKLREREMLRQLRRANAALTHLRNQEGGSAWPSHSTYGVYKTHEILKHVEVSEIDVPNALRFAGIRTQATTGKHILPKLRRELAYAYCNRHPDCLTAARDFDLAAILRNKPNLEEMTAEQLFRQYAKNLMVAQGDPGQPGDPSYNSSGSVQPGYMILRYSSASSDGPAANIVQAAESEYDGDRATLLTVPKPREDMTKDEGMSVMRWVDYEYEAARKRAIEIWRELRGAPMPDEPPVDTILQELERAMETVYSWQAEQLECLEVIIAGLSILGGVIDRGSKEEPLEKLVNRINSYATIQAGQLQSNPTLEEAVICIALFFGRSSIDEAIADVDDELNFVGDYEPGLPYEQGDLESAISHSKVSGDRLQILYSAFIDEVVPGLHLKKRNAPQAD